MKIFTLHALKHSNIISKTKTARFAAGNLNGMMDLWDMKRTGVMVAISS